ncbi:energy-coupling factor ABC transporter permease [Streptomyces sp. Z26]|uniref:energy-coupling factor ABC transporter permease n=1 Tax=Streptomyces sp. Z26 TaxID=2500177 RepID=UPI000EF1396D|nr:energy-coupling factor ABC transporter permease [Streptomyces sp. Z26]RLL67275.1 cobalt ABC transporter permease [Streptomyces sp. Z26]
MHVPDGFIDAPVSLAAGAVAAGAVAVSLRGARRELAGPAGAGGLGEERTAPLAGLVAAFVFAVQMLNFPVAGGTSGHLLGGALAAVLVGPYTGVLCVSVVLLMQSVLFADGGLTALGVNITDMAVVAVPVAYGLFRALVRVLPRGRGAVTGAAFAAALVSVPAAAVAFTALYALGGTADVSLGKVFTAMVGVHVLIGLGEAAITALTVGAVLSVRPDLVYGARGVTAPLVLRDVTAAVPGGGTAATTEDAARADAEGAPAEGVPAEPAAVPAPVRGRSTRRVWLAGLATALVCAGVVSFYASADPDGLEKVAADQGIDEQAEEHGLADSPLADYGVADISDTRLSGGTAGVIGVGATLAVGTGVFVVVRRRRASAPAPAASASGADRDGH